MKSHLLVLFFSIILISGCIGGGTSTHGPGVVINTFSFSFTNINDRDQVDLALSIQNLGGKTVSKVKTYVYGPLIEESSKSSCIWTISSGDEDLFTKDGWLVKDLMPPDIETNLEGDRAQELWILRPPLLDEGVSNTYTFEARTCFPYETTAWATVTGISGEERRIQQQQGKDFVSVMTENTGGPITVDILSRNPTVFYDNDLILNFAIKVTEGESGFVTIEDSCPRTAESDFLNKLEISSITIGGKSIDVDDACDDETIVLFQGQGNKRCQYEIDDAPPNADYVIMVTLKYDYYTTKQASITVTDAVGDTDGTCKGTTSAKKEDECDNNDDCSSDEECRLGKCRELDCSSDEYPYRHECVECRNRDSDCNSNEECINKKCVKKENGGVTGCTDSDRGENYYEKGTTTGPLLDGTIVTRTDFCVGDFVYEFACNQDAPYNLYQKSYDCPNNCEDGACKTSNGDGTTECPEPYCRKKTGDRYSDICTANCPYWFNDIEGIEGTLCGYHNRIQSGC